MGGSTLFHCNVRSKYSTSCRQAISLFDKVLDGTSEVCILVPYRLLVAAILDFVLSPCLQHQNLQENLRVDRFADILQVLEEDGSERYTSILAVGLFFTSTSFALVSVSHRLS